MAATVEIHELNGAGQTATDKTAGSIRFKKTDNSTVDLNDLLSVPTSGTEYSMQKWLRMNVTGGSYTQISNPRFYTDGGNGYGTGCKLWAKTRRRLRHAGHPFDVRRSAAPLRRRYGRRLLLHLGQPARHGRSQCRAVHFDGLQGRLPGAGVRGRATASQGVKSAETLTLAWDEI